MIASPTFSKFCRFITVGIICAALFFAINYSLRVILSVGEFWSLATTYAICFWIGYVSQRNFAFRSDSWHRRSLPRYFIMHFVGMLFVYYFTHWMRSEFELGDLSSSLVATGLAGMASFIISLTWVFQSSDATLRAQTRR